MDYKLTVEQLTFHGSIPVTVVANSNTYTVEVEVSTLDGRGTVSYNNLSSNLQMEVYQLALGYTGSVGSSGAVGSTGPQTKAFNVFCSGQPASNEYIGGGLSPYSMTINANNSSAKALSPSTASSVFTVFNNGLAVGTITYLTSNTALISMSYPVIAANDHIYVQSPVDSTTAPSNISIVLKE